MAVTERSGRWRHSVLTYSPRVAGELPVLELLPINGGELLVRGRGLSRPPTQGRSE